MKKTFLRLTMLACIGAMFSIGLTIISVNKSPNVHAAGGHSVEIHTGGITLLTEGLITTKIVIPGTNSEPAELFGIQSLTGVETGTTISIIAKSDSLFEFKGFDEDLQASEIVANKDGSDSELRFKVERDIIVEVVYVENSFTSKLKIVGMQGVEEIPLGDSIRVSIEDNPNLDDNTINGVERNYIDYATAGIPIKPGQELEFIAFDGLEGYKFIDILIKPKGSDSHSFRLNSQIDNANSDKKTINGDTVTYNYDRIFNTIFFDEYLSNDSEILLEISLEKTCKVTFVYPTEMGNKPTVDEKLPNGTWAEDVDINKYFDIGTKIRVTAKPKDYHTFKGFDRLAFTGDTNEFEIFDNRTINLNFVANTYQIQSNLNTTATKTEFRVGEKVTFTYDVSSMRTIKNWKLFNADKTEEFGTDVISRNGNGFTVTLTGDMLKNGKFVLQHEVSDAIKPAIIAGISIPSVVIPLLLILMALFIITDVRRKKVIKAALEGKWEKLKTRDVGGFIAAVREGATGEVSKEDIKKAMKEQKEEKKNAQKTKAETVTVSKVKAEPAPSAEPKAKETATVAQKKAAAPKTPVVTAANLIGSKIMPDRSIVVGTNVIGTLQTDATIKDMAGKVFASARLDDGAILDQSGNVIGKITGDGTIAKS